MIAGIETTPSKTSIHKSSGYSPCSSLGMVYEIGELALMEQIERESAQTPVGVDVSNNASPNGKASVSSSHGNHGSGFSVASGDNVRPMAAGSAEISAMHFSACPNTAKLPSHGGVTGVNSHRTFSGITYESDEEMLMDQIEKESLRL